MDKTKIMNDILQETDGYYRINVIGFDKFGIPCSEDVCVEKSDVEIVSDKEILISTTTYWELCRWLDMIIKVLD